MLSFPHCLYCIPSFPILQWTIGVRSRGRGSRWTLGSLWTRPLLTGHTSHHSRNLPSTSSSPAVRACTLLKTSVYMYILQCISESSWGATQTNTHLWYIVLGDRVLNGDLILHYILQVISHSSPLCFQVSTPSSVRWFCLVF